MPAGFAVPTAAADSLTAVLAASAFLGLQRGWGVARGLAWACTLVGSVAISAPEARFAQEADRADVEKSLRVTASRLSRFYRSGHTS